MAHCNAQIVADDIARIVQRERDGIELRTVGYELAEESRRVLSSMRCRLRRFVLDRVERQRPASQAIGVCDGARGLALGLRINRPIT